MTNATKFLNQARSLRDAKRLAEACHAYSNAAQADPQNVEIWTELAATLNSMNRHNEALQALARVGRINPQHVPALIEASRAELKLGRPQQAAAALRRATSIEPNNALAMREFAIALHAGNAGLPSLQVIQRAHALAPDDAETSLILGMMLADHGAAESALPHLERAAAKVPGARQLASLANCLSSLSRIEEAHAAVEKAAAINPRFPGVPYTRAKIAEAMGRADEAIRIAEEAIRDGSAQQDLVQKFADLMKRHPRRGEAIDLLRQVANQPQLQPVKTGHAWYGLGSLLDAEGRYAEAFECFRKANEMGAPPFDAEATRRRTETVMNLYSKEMLERLPKGDPADRRPVFVVGMPRSGTTLLERIIGSHPEAAGAGELGTIPRLFASLAARVGIQGTPPDALKLVNQQMMNDMAAEYIQRLTAAAPSASRIVDKMPHNFIQLGLISVMFPGATLIHSSRHPLDTCLSCYMTHLSVGHGYAFSLRGLAVEYTEYRRLMDYWRSILGDRITDVVYERVVADLESEARRIIGALRLPWNDSCLSFHKSSGPVLTASVNQVRRPIYDSSVNRWKNYEPYLGELIDGLRQFL